MTPTVSNWSFGKQKKIEVQFYVQKNKNFILYDDNFFTFINFFGFIKIKLQRKYISEFQKL
jgi:hypothetical protein